MVRLGVSGTWPRQQQQARNKKMWAAEFAKLAVLALLSAVVLYSSAAKYWKYAQSLRVADRVLTADYSLYCGKYSGDRYNSCKETLDSAIADASVSCKGYLDKEASCFSTYGQRSQKCQSKTQAVDGCASLVCTTSLTTAGFV